MKSKNVHHSKDPENVFVVYRPIRTLYNRILFLSSKPNKVLYFCIILLKILLTLVCIREALNDVQMRNSPTETPLTLAIDRLRIVVDGVGFILVILQVYMHYPVIRQILKRIEEFDKCLSFNYGKVYTSDGGVYRSRRILIGIFVLINSYHFIRSAVGTITYFKKFLFCIWIDVFVKLHITVILAQNAYILSLVRWRFYYLHEFIKHSDYSVLAPKKHNDPLIRNWNIKEYTISVDISKREVKDLRQKLALARILYGSLNEIISLSNSSFGKYYPVMILLTFIELIHGFFYLFIAFVSHFENVNIFWGLLFFSFFGITLSFGTFSIAIIYYSHRIKKEVNK